MSTEEKKSLVVCNIHAKCFELSNFSFCFGFYREITLARGDNCHMWKLPLHLKLHKADQRYKHSIWFDSNIQSNTESYANFQSLPPQFTWILLSMFRKLGVKSYTTTATWTPLLEMLEYQIEPCSNIFWRCIHSICLSTRKKRASSIIRHGKNFILSNICRSCRVSNAWKLHPTIYLD